MAGTSLDCLFRLHVLGITCLGDRALIKDEARRPIRLFRLGKFEIIESTDGK